MNHYCVVLLTVFALVAYTSAAATTTVAPSSGNNLVTIAGNVRHLMEQIVCAIRAFIKLMESFGTLGGGMGLFLINPWINGMQVAIRFLQSLIGRIPFL